MIFGSISIFGALLPASARGAKKTENKAQSSARPDAGTSLLGKMDFIGWCADDVEVLFVVAGEAGVRELLVHAHELDEFLFPPFLIHVGEGEDIVYAAHGSDEVL